MELWRRPQFAEKLYDFLNVGEVPERADSIFVFAGRQERKPFGIDLWRRGYATELILSVGRFEWRRFYDLGLPDGGLLPLVESTTPQERHFFIRFHEAEAICRRSIRKSRFGTLSEGMELAEQLSANPPRALIVVSTSIHLRRACLVLRRTLTGRGVRLIPVAVPEELSSLRRRDLRQNSAARLQVFREFQKYIAYLILLSLGAGR